MCISIIIKYQVMVLILLDQMEFTLVDTLPTMPCLLQHQVLDIQLHQVPTEEVVEDVVPAVNRIVAAQKCLMSDS